MNLHLTNREREVLNGLFDGQCQKQIAARLKLSIKTIDYYVQCIYTKCGSHNAVQAVRWGIEHGYLPPVFNLQHTSTSIAKDAAIHDMMSIK